MTWLSTLKTLAPWNKTKPQKNPSAPPRYEESYTTTKTPIKQAPPPQTQTRPPILASSTPQWKWTHAECQEWFLAVLTTNFGYGPEEAKTMAAKLEGFGPNIYSRTCGKWKEMLGEEQGEGLYMWLLGVRRRRGAVPRGIRMNHGNPVKR